MATSSVIFDAASGSYKSYINGAWLRSASNKLVTITNPSTRKEQFKVQACTREEIDSAYEGCSRAQEEWRAVPLWQRAEALKRVAAILREKKDTIADCLVNEVAKARKDSLSEVERSADLIEYCAEEGLRLLSKGDLLTSDAFKGTPRNKLCMASRVPLGTVLCIPPFNYPVNLAVSKMAPALIAGNAVLVKPPTQGAVAGLHLAQCFHESGLFPQGLVNVLTVRASENGNYLAEHAKCDCLSFTGGDTGLSLAKKVGMVPIQMELGGKDACVVCEDADLDLAAKHIIKGGFSYSGQRCTAVKVVLAQDAVADALVEKVLAGVKALTVGMPDDNCQITPVISSSSADYIEELVKVSKRNQRTNERTNDKKTPLRRRQHTRTRKATPSPLSLPTHGCFLRGRFHDQRECKRVDQMKWGMKWGSRLTDLIVFGVVSCRVVSCRVVSCRVLLCVQDAKEKGATFLTEYKREGNLIWPVLLDHVRPDMRVAWEEPFGPVVPVMRVASAEEAVAHANKNRYALQGSVFSRDIDNAIRLAHAMSTGTVQINGAPARGPDHFPFQGFRDSGIGSQGITNSIGLMTKTKSVVINLASPSYTF